MTRRLGGIVPCRRPRLCGLPLKVFAWVGCGLEESQFIRDKVPSPSVLQQPAVGVYVDNVNVLGCGRGRVQGVMDSISSRFSQLGIPFEVTDQVDCRRISSLGLEFDFTEGAVVRNTVART